MTQCANRRLSGSLSLLLVSALSVPFPLSGADGVSDTVPAGSDGALLDAADSREIPEGMGLGAGRAFAAVAPEAETPADAPARSWFPSGWTDAARSFESSIRRSIAGNEVTLSDRQRGSLEGMRPVLSELAGPDGMFNRADTPDVVRSLQPSLDQRVRWEIRNRANQTIQEGMFPRVRGVFVNGHVQRNYGRYHSQGMAQADAMVRSGLEEFYSGVGVEGAGTPGESRWRQIDLDAMERFRAGAETLREIDRQRNAPVQVVFPGGFGEADLNSILSDPNRIPPNGRVVPRVAPVQQAPAASAARPVAISSSSTSGQGRSGGVFRRGGGGGIFGGRRRFGR